MEINNNQKEMTRKLTRLGSQLSIHYGKLGFGFMCVFTENKMPKKEKVPDV